MTGMVGVQEFAAKVGVSDATIYNWIALGKIPFKVTDTGRKLIPEFEALEAPVVVAKRAKAGLMPVKQPVMPVIEPPIEVPQISQAKIDDRDEKLFLIARQQAQHFITRARFCRQDKRHEAEAELLWMAVECFGFKQ